MKKNIAIMFIILLALVGGYFIINGKDNPDTNIDEEKVTYGLVQDSVLGFEFEYPEEPDGYIVLEESNITDPDYVAGLNLFNKKEYGELQASTNAREAPPVMHLQVYRNDAKLHSAVWVERKPQASGIERAFEKPKEVVMGGANAVQYIVDGLYVAETYVVANGAYVYVLSGEYLDKESKIYKDFQALVKSFTFIPSPSQINQGKIDTQVACESALAYMTFPSSKEADDFVNACVLGEHPEVIERYIKDMGLNESAI